MILFYAVGALIVIVLIVAAMLPSSYHVQQSIIIKAPVPDVMERVGNLNFYKQWNPWQQMEPEAQAEIVGEPVAPGHKYTWQGRRIGSGSLLLKQIDKKHIHFDLQFLRPWKSSASDNWLFEEWGDGGTKVTWQNFGNLSYPMARLFGPTLNKQLNQQFITGLENLKKMCEGG
ncbi:MAG TPA: SRPBCC family protein [Parasegetibacter sp.]|jgi:hypothetical protein